MSARKAEPAPFSSLADQCLLERYCMGDEQAFEILVHRYQTELYQFVKGYLGRDDAEDVVQWVWLQLFVSVPTLHRHASPRGVPASIRRWLYRVARNRCVDVLRKRKRERLLAVDWEDIQQESGEPLVSQIADPALLPEELVVQAEQQQSLQTLLGTLPPRFRTVIWLRSAQGLSFKAIGQRLSIPISTAKTYYYRGCRRLRTALALAHEQEHVTFVRQVHNSLASLHRQTIS